MEPDTLNLLQGLRRHVALTAGRARDDRDTFDQERGSAPAETPCDPSYASVLLSADIASHSLIFRLEHIRRQRGICAPASVGPFAFPQLRQ